MRYHLFPFLVPKWVPYELQTRMGAAPDFDKTELAWDHILKVYHKKWYKRWIYQPWFAWEYHVTPTAVRIFFITPDEYLGSMTWDSYANQLEDTFFIENAPPEFNFNKPHAGVKMELERDFSVPIMTVGEQDGSVDPYSYLLSMLNEYARPDMHSVVQFCIRPIYDSQVYSHFMKAVRKVEKSEGVADENERYIQVIREKMYKRKAEVGIKIAVFGPNDEAVHNTLNTLAHGFGSFQSEEFNRLEYKEWWRIIRPLFRYELQHRIFPMRLGISNANVLGTGEMANLLRHPTTASASRFYKLRFSKVSIPMPIRLQSQTDQPKIYLGKSEHMANDIDTNLPLELLNGHMTVIGPRNSGKADFLVNIVTQIAELSDDENKMGFTVIDTVGNLAKEIIARIPKEKQHRIRALKLNDLSFPMNLFEWEGNMPPENKLRLLSYFFNEGDWSPTILDHFIMIGTALHKLNLATLRNLQRFFEDAEFRERIYFFLKDMDDPEYVPVKRYLEKYSSLDAFQREFYNVPISQKIRSFNTSGTTGPFRKKTNALNFQKYMSEGAFQIIDISDMPADDGHTTGKNILPFLYLAILTRGRRMLSEGKTPSMHPIIIDEASGFLSDSIFRTLDTFIDEARRYRTPLIFSLQGISNHIPDEVAVDLFRRTASYVAFRLPNINDAQFFIDNTNSHITGVTADDLTRIDPRYCYISIPDNRQPSGVFTLRPDKLEPGKYYHIVDDLFKQTTQKVEEEEKKAVEEMNRQEEERIRIWEREKEAFRAELKKKHEKLARNQDLEDYIQFMYGKTGELKFGQIDLK